VLCVAISPDGGLATVAHRDTIVRLWDAQTGQLIECLVEHNKNVLSMAFTPDGKGLVSGSVDSTLKHWDLGPMLIMRGQSYEVGVGDAGSVVSEESGQDKGVCVCTVDFMGHTVRGRLPAFPFSLLSELVSHHASHAVMLMSIYVGCSVLRCRVP
jgi:glucose repression regulatory protein TUP1